MIYFKWFILTVFKLFILLPSLLVAPQVIALFTKSVPQDLPIYTWGGWWGTYDNPPQGDESFVEEGAFFPNITTGLKGYINRVQWMWRNKLYGYNKLTSIDYDVNNEMTFIGDPAISDRAKHPGWYFAKLHNGKKLIGFEFYCVLPWSETRDLRCRIGWKMMTSKFAEYGFAQLVTTCNPFDGYGKKVSEV